MNDNAPQQTDGVIPYGDPRVSAGQPLPPGGPHRLPEVSRTNSAAIGSLVLGIVGGGLLSLVFGIVALRQIERRGEKGRGLAIAGIALSAAWMVALAALLVVVVVSGSDKPAERTPLFMLTAGTCVNDVLEPGDGLTASLPEVPCSEPHEGEVFATFRMNEGPWPGEAEVETRAGSTCETRYAAYTTRGDDSIQLLVLQPTSAAAWNADRSIFCIAVDTDGPSTGSLAD